MSGRDLSSDMVAALAAADKRPLYLVKAEFDSGDVCLWTGLGDLAYGGDTYSGIGTLMQVNLPSETATTRASGGSIVLSGADPSIAAIADTENYQGRPITVRFALKDTAGAVIVDPDTAFRGIVDVIEPELTREAAGVVVRIESKSALRDKAVERKLTPEDQALTYPGDKGFDFVAGLALREVQWGPRG